MKTRAISIAAAAAMLAGCSVATTVRQNTMAINGSSATIGSNTAAIRESTMATTAPVPALQGPRSIASCRSPRIAAISEFGLPLRAWAITSSSGMSIFGLGMPGSPR